MRKPITVGVVGAGLMGHGIAQVFARAGNKVVLTDANSDALASALARIDRNLREEGVDPEPILRNLSTTASLADAVSKADFVIEAAPEKPELKQALFGDIVQAAPASAILASNTSVIPITRIGEKLPQEARARLVGTHWWNPPHLVPLVEVVRTADTADHVFQQTYDWLEEAGKRPVKVNRDVTGFIGNRLQLALWREAIGLIEAGVCDAEAIDTVVKSSFGMRLPVLGPMENADLIGLELSRDVQRVMFPDLRNDTAPSPLLDKLIAEGHVGMKAGKGLRTWTPDEAEQVRRTLSAHLIKTTKT